MTASEDLALMVEARSTIGRPNGHFSQEKPLIGQHLLVVSAYTNFLLLFDCILEHLLEGS